MTRALMVVMTLLALPMSARAQDASAFAGEWKNTAKQPQIAGARIYRAGEQWMVQLLGACTPTRCVWDPVPLTIRSGGTLDPLAPATATTTANNGSRKVTLRLGEDALQVEVLSPRSIPQARVVVNVLARVKATTEPLPPTRRAPPKR